MLTRPHLHPDALDQPKRCLESALRAWVRVELKLKLARRVNGGEAIPCGGSAQGHKSARGGLGGSETHLLLAGWLRQDSALPTRS